MSTRNRQLDSLGIAADAYNGLVVVEIQGPPIVPLSTSEARRFLAYFERAYRDALLDQDALQDPRNLRSALTRSEHAELVPDGTYGGARRVVAA